MYIKRLNKTKKYLLWTLSEVLDIANGCAAMSIPSKDLVIRQFGRKVLFRQLYELIKFSKQYIYN